MSAVWSRSAPAHQPVRLGNRREMQQQAGQPAHSYLQPVSASLRYSASIKGPEALASTAACADTVPSVCAKARKSESSYGEGSDK